MIKVWVNDKDFIYVCSLHEVVQPDGTVHIVLNAQNVTDLRARLEPFDKNEQLLYNEDSLTLDGIEEREDQIGSD